MLYGPGQDQTGYNYPLELPKPRDCTDIAVKIAFELNEQQRKIPLPKYNFLGDTKNVFDVAAKMMIFTLTNQREATAHGSSFLNANAREAQSTDANIREGALKKQVENYRPSSPKKR